MNELRRAEDILAEMRQARTADRRAPTGTGLEGRVTALLCSVLGTGKVDATTTFGGLGGDSLLAVRVLSQCRREFGVELPLRALGASTTVPALTAAVRAELDGTRPATERFGKRPARPDGTVPTTANQRALAGLHAVDPALPTYHVPLALDLVGEVDPARLRGAFRALLDRHEALRTTFHVTDGLLAARLDSAEHRAEHRAEDWAETDLAGAADDVVAAAVDRAACDPFDLATAPVRARLLRTGPRRHVLVLTAHHAVCDGLSVQVMVHDLLVLYRDGSPAGLPVLSVGATDLAWWSEQRLTGDRRAQRHAAWQRILDGAPEVMALPVQAPRPARLRGGDRMPLHVPASVLDRLRAVGVETGTTVFCTLTAALALVLRRYTGQDDLVLGFPVSGRDEPETEGVVGYLSATVPMRVVTDDRCSVPDLLTRVQDAVLDAQENADLPFDEISQAAGRRRGGAPPLQVAITLLSGVDKLPDVPGVAVHRTDLGTHTAKFDLSWYFDEEAHGLAGYLEYSTELFPAGLAAQLVAEFAAVLIRLADQPARAVQTAEPGPEQLAFLIDGLCGPTVERREWIPVHQRVDGEPDHAANRLAATLAERGLRAGEPVAVDAGEHAGIAMLAVLRAGGICVPLAPGMPADRILTESGALLRIRGGEVQGHAARSSARPGHIAFLVYGSLPVVFTHRGLAELADVIDHADAATAERVLGAGRATWAPVVALACGLDLPDRLAADDLVSIEAPALGARVRGTRLYVLDSSLQPVPRGAVGDLYAGGAALAHGYHNRPGPTADRFVPDPFATAPGQRMVRTGLRVRRTLENELVSQEESDVEALRLLTPAGLLARIEELPTAAVEALLHTIDGAERS